MVHKILTEEEQVIYTYARIRSRGFRNISKNLFRTHFYSIPTSSIPIGAFERSVGISYRLGPMCFQTAIVITNAGSQQGMIFGYGGATNSITAWVENDKIVLQVGDNEGTPNNNSTVLSFDTTGLPNGHVLEIAFTTVPGSERVRLWVNGQIVARSNSVVGSYTGGVWAGNVAGSFADVPLQTYLGVPVASRIAPSGFDVIEPLSIFSGQIPRHFH